MVKFAICPEGAESLSALARKLIVESNLIVQSAEKLEREIASYADDLGAYSEAILAIASKSKHELIQNKQDIERLSFLLQKKAGEIAAIYSRVSAPTSAAGICGVSSGLYFKTNVPEKNRSESQQSSQEEVSRAIGFLPHTEQRTFTLENGNTVFNAPQITGTHLNYDQGHAVPNYKGTCGIVSCENVARLAGKDVTEADAVRIAIEGGYCDKGSPFPDNNGGTSPKDRKGILASLGVGSVIDEDLSVSHIASEVEAGKGVIASVETSKFWPNYSAKGFHAVTVTSVERDSLGSPVAFYVCDSGYDGSHFARRINASDFANALSGKALNVTSGPIR